ncbi:MAG: hypothetical protein FWD93_00965 [Coriobacteriia bacterium]|nr:hypothetical protein [Coriobacteriia bacterium]
MRVKVYWQNGKIQRFDLSRYQSESPDDKTIATEYSLRLDELEKEGLRVDIFRYGSKSKSEIEHNMYGSKIKLTEAQFAPGLTGFTIGLIIPQELSEIVRIDVDGIKVVWRFGEHLINGIKFYGQLEMYLGDNPGSFNSNAVVLFERMKSVYPRATDKELAAMMGLPYKAWSKILECEMLEGFDDEEVGTGMLATAHSQTKESGSDSDVKEGVSANITAALDNLLEK